MSTIRALNRGHRPSAVAYRSASPFQTAFDAVVAAFAWLEDKLEKRRSRRVLRDMSDHQLKDIGLSRADAAKEAARPFWD